MLARALESLLGQVPTGDIWQRSAALAISVSSKEPVQTLLWRFISTVGHLSQRGGRYSGCQNTRSLDSMQGSVCVVVSLTTQQRVISFHYRLCFPSSKDKVLLSLQVCLFVCLNLVKRQISFWLDSVSVFKLCVYVCAYLWVYVVDFHSKCRVTFWALGSAQLSGWCNRGSVQQY